MPAGRWSAATKAWWKTWSESEQAARFTPTAWQRLAMLVPLIEEFYKRPHRLLLAEIAKNESLLGATPTDLARLGWKLDGPKAPAQPDNLVELYPDVEVES